MLLQCTRSVIQVLACRHGSSRQRSTPVTEIFLHEITDVPCHLLFVVVEIVDSPSGTNCGGVSQSFSVFVCLFVACFVVVGNPFFCWREIPSMAQADG